MTLHKNSLKLATLYLAIIAAISLIFSVVIYQLSVQELERGLRRPSIVLSKGQISINQQLRDDLLHERSDYFEEARLRVLQRLIAVNLIILIAGGALSYYLAVRTLKPIEDAHEAQSRFTADASHELRTPITAMMTENEVTLMDPKLTLKNAKKQIESNIEELGKLSSLSDGLMRLAGLDNATLRKERVTLQEVAQEATARIAPQANEKSIVVKQTNPKTPLHAVGDFDSLVEALVIVLDNAIKYSNPNTEVHLALTKNRELCQITIVDSGIGIKKEDIPYLFDRFYRADSSRSKKDIQGYGLGLAIAKNIIDKHNGTINVKSTVGAGSTFTIALPSKRVS